MRRWVKRGLKIFGGLVLFIAALFGGIAYSAFGGNTDIVDGATPSPDVRIVKDGFVDFGVIDVGGGKVALVDAGNDPKGAALLAELSRRGLGPEAVVAIFLTHGHADHLAGAHLCPNATVYALQADVGLAEGREGSHGVLTGMIGVKPTGLHVRALTDRDVTTVGESQVRVFAVPGHTGGSAAYLVSSVLFLGDSAGMKTDGRLAGAPRAFSDDSKQNRAALKALADTLRPEQAQSPIVAIVPAHTGTAHWGDLDAFVP
jgi:glyoxylase-like metal-dependent hydrolase (beta-lactamase superfamily II)